MEDKQDECFARVSKLLKGKIEFLQLHEIIVILERHGIKVRTEKVTKKNMLKLFSHRENHWDLIYLDKDIVYEEWYEEEDNEKSFECSIKFAEKKVSMCFPRSLYKVFDKDNLLDQVYEFIANTEFNCSEDCKTFEKTLVNGTVVEVGVTVRRYKIKINIDIIESKYMKYDLDERGVWVLRRYKEEVWWH